MKCLSLLLDVAHKKSAYHRYWMGSFILDFVFFFVGSFRECLDFVGFFFIDGVIFAIVVVVILICTATLSLLLLTALNCSFWRASTEP